MEPKITSCHFHACTNQEVELAPTPLYGREGLFGIDFWKCLEVLTASQNCPVFQFVRHIERSRNQPARGGAGRKVWILNLARITGTDTPHSCSSTHEPDGGDDPQPRRRGIPRLRPSL